MPEETHDVDPVLGGSGTIEMVNARQDAPTVYADAVQGMMISDLTIKVCFIEHLLQDDGEGSVKGRYVLNLAMPAPQLRAMGELFINIANNMGK